MPDMAMQYSRRNRFSRASFAGPFLGLHMKNHFHLGTQSSKNTCFWPFAVGFEIDWTLSSNCQWEFARLLVCKLICVISRNGNTTINFFPTSFIIRLGCWNSKRNTVYALICRFKLGANIDFFSDVSFILEMAFLPAKDFSLNENLNDNWNIQ